MERLFASLPQLKVTFIIYSVNCQDYYNLQDCQFPRLEQLMHNENLSEEY